MKSRDGGVQRFSWAREGAAEGAGYRCWVTAHPQVNARGATWEEASGALYTAVDETLQAGEWTADWFPPEPAPAGAAFRADQRYVVLAGEGRVIVETPAAEAFGGGACGRCGRGLGERLHGTLRVSVEILGGMMSSTARRPGQIEGALFLRETTGALLGPAGLGGAELRAAERVGRGRARILEILPGPIIAAPAPVRGAEFFGGRCVCGMVSFSNRVGPSRYVDVYEEDRIPSSAESFWVGGPAGPSLVVPAGWWAERRSSPAARGLVARPLYSAARGDITPMPPLTAATPTAKTPTPT